MSAVTVECLPNSPDIPDEEIAEAERCALARLKCLTASENERVALKASELILKYAHQQRRERAKALPVPAPKADPRPPVAAPKATPVARVPDRLTNPKPTAGAFRAVPDLPPEKLAALLPEG